MYINIHVRHYDWTNFLSFSLLGFSFSIPFHCLHVSYSTRAPSSGIGLPDLEFLQWLCPRCNINWCLAPKSAVPIHSSRYSNPLWKKRTYTIKGSAWQIGIFFTILIVAVHNNRNDNFTLMTQILLPRVLDIWYISFLTNEIYKDRTVVLGIVNLRDLSCYKN